MWLCGNAHALPRVVTGQGAGSTDPGVHAPTLSSGSLLPQLPCSGLIRACPVPKYHLFFSPESQAPPILKVNDITFTFAVFSHLSKKIQKHLCFSDRRWWCVSTLTPVALILPPRSPPCLQNHASSLHTHTSLPSLRLPSPPAQPLPVGAAILPTRSLFVSLSLL